MSGDATPDAPLDARLVAWMAALLLADEHARLIESGADRDARVPLAKVFVDLSATRCVGRLPTKGSALRELVRGGDDGAETAQPLWLLLGGPGAGKSTVTAMAAQVLRALCVSAQPEAVPKVLQERVGAVNDGLRSAAVSRVALTADGGLPVRVSLPAFARRFADARGGVADDALFEHLAATMGADLRAVGHDAECSAAEMRAMLRAAARVTWLFDGLDEVPAGDLRAAVSRALHEVIAARRPGDRAVITTRPQGYGGEFDALPTMELDALDWLAAMDFCERLVKATGRPVDERELRATLTREFNRPEVQALARSPLHAAIVASFIERQDDLPRSRWVLFERYFNVLFDRELRKLSAAGIKSEQRERILELHARAGLALHVRAQAQPAATLSVRELRAMMVAFYQEEDPDEEHAEEKAGQLLRFASERLVLLLRVAEGGYGFGVRPLQEFFAARALWTLDAAVLRKRLDAVVVAPHWANVVALLASGAAVVAVDTMSRRAASVLVEVCGALNDGTVGGLVAARCLLGSRLAIALLRETEGYGGPWLLDPLWQEALRIAEAPVQRGALEWVRTYDASGRGDGVSAVWDDDEEIPVRLGLLAFFSEGASSERRRADVLACAERLMGGSESDRWSAWHLLLGGLRDDRPDAMRVALAHPPMTRDEGEGVVQALLWSVRGRRVPRVVSEFIKGQPEWFTPGWLYKTHRGRWQDEASWPPALRISARLSAATPRAFSVLFFPTSSWTGALEVVPLAGQPQAIWEEIASLARREVPHAEVWTKVASFHCDPTAASLAALLDGIDAASFEELRDIKSAFAWPLAACLSHVDDVGQFAPLATSLRVGALGDTTEWLAAESRWREDRAVDAAQWSRWVIGSTPWATDEDSPPVTSFSNTTLRLSPAREPEYYRTTILSALATYGAVARRAVWAAARTLSGFLRMGIWSGGVPHEIANLFRDAAWPSPGASLTAVNAALPELDGADAGPWFELLDHRGRLGLTTLVPVRAKPAPRVTRNIQHIARYWSAHLDRWGLASTLVALLTCVPGAPLDDLRLSAPPGEVSESGLAQWTLLALLSMESLPADLASPMQRFHGVHAGGPYDYRHTLASILARRAMDPARTEALLVAALESTTEADFLVREDLLGALLAHLRRTAPLAFSDARAWEEDYQFSPPHIAMQPPMPSPPRLLSIDALTNLRLFRETPIVDAPFPTPSPDRGQWIVLIGENGVGKTTLLRALALALVSPEVATKQLHSRLMLVRNGGPARLSFAFSSGKYEAEILRVDGGATETVTTGGDSPERPWVVGYGVQRGGALGDAAHVVDWAPEGNLLTLFGRRSVLVDAQDWILRLDRRVQRERAQAQAQAGVSAPSTPAGDLWNAVVNALQSALELKEITAGDDEDVVYVEHRDFGRVRLESLSDGYLGTAGWIVDLIARWVRQREADGDVLTGDILGQMTGVVLVDEIDLHLHPRWQMRVIEDVRRIFPRLTFIVTTHNPLTLQGARPGEVFIMRRGDEGGRVELAQRDIQTGYDIDRVLLEHFGIEHTFDRKTRELLQRHRKLVNEGVPPSDPDRVALEEELAGRLGDFGDALVAQRAKPPLTDVQRKNLERFRQRRGASS